MTISLRFAARPRVNRPPRRLVGALAAVLGLFAGACSSETGASSTGDTPDSGPPSDASPGDSSILIGTFQVRLVPPVPATQEAPETPGLTSVLGKLYDGPSLSQIVWEEAAKEGACRLSTPRVPFCNEPCGGSAACVEDDTCKPYPAAHSAGTVKAIGLKTESGPSEFSMAPVANSYQPPAGVKLLYPAFAEGDAIRMEASGDYFSAFTLEAKGISPLELLNDTIVIEPDKPVKLTWTPPGQAGLSTIQVKLDISHHGGTKGVIECEAEDTGSLELPASLITQLTDLGVAGFPTIVLTRRAAVSVTIAPGRVDLVIASSIERAVQIPGVTSCTDTSSCPDGQTCQPDLTCK